MTTIAELRSMVRTQTQTDAADLPDVTIDSYLQQGFERTINGETQWPFYAQTWELVQDPDAVTLTLPGDVNVPGIMALSDMTSGLRLSMVPQAWAEDHFLGVRAGSNTSSLLYSVWGDQVYLWPAIAFAGARRYSLRGYRRPVVWLADDSPDCDPRLHLALTHYAVALAYAQQEDESLEATYMQRWQQDAELARRAIMEPVHHRPMTMGGAVHYSGPEFVPTGYIVTTPP